MSHPQTESSPSTPPNSQTLIISLVVAAVIGVIAAVFASVFLMLVESGQELLFHSLPHALGLEAAPWWLVGLFLLIAAGIVALARRMPGHTGASPLTGFHFDVPVGAAGSILIAAFASLIAGAALGPEAPLIVLGTTIGAILTAKRPEHIRKAMMFVGGTAAISAVFGNPFITAFMILEFMALGIAPVSLLLPVFTALSSGYLVSIGIWNIPGLSGHPLSLPGLPAYESIAPGDILIGLLVALIAAIVALVARGSAELIDRFAQKRSTIVLLGAAIVTTVVLAIGESIFGVEQNLILFSGNSGMAGLIAQTSLGLVVFILFAKALAYAVALGGGFRGGPIFPVTFLGVAVGVLASLIFPGDNVSAFAAAGIAGSAAAFLKLPATSALLAMLLIVGAGPAIAPFAIFGAVIGFALRLFVDSRVTTDVNTHNA